jgi:hypothetical protein
MMAGDAPDAVFSNWHNESNPSDVNGDGAITAVDALIAINSLSRFDEVSVGDIQARLHEADAAADELYGGYHPDVDFSGTLTALDALRIINQLTRVSASPNDVPISVIPDAQGSPLRIVYTAADGRSKEVDVSQLDVSISWSGGEVFATDFSDQIVVIAKPGVGVLEVDNSLEDGQAIVTRFGSDGTQVAEHYVCVPETIWDLENGVVFLVEPTDVRRPIIGFEEVLGAMVEKRTVHLSGHEIVLRYEEAAAPNLIAVIASLPTGKRMEVNVEGATNGTGTIILGPNESGQIVTTDLEAFEADLVYLLQLGYQPFETLTPSEVFVALEAERAG